MVGPESGWQVLEARSYSPSVERLGGARNCDEALSPILYALQRNPLGFEEMPGIRGGIRIAKTKLKISGIAVIPAMRLWFRVEVMNRQVHLLYVEACPAEQMGYTEDWKGDDDIPF